MEAEAAHSVEEDDNHKEEPRREEKKRRTNNKDKRMKEDMTRHMIAIAALGLVSLSVAAQET